MHHGAWYGSTGKGCGSWQSKIKGGLTAGVGVGNHLERGDDDDGLNTTTSVNETKETGFQLRVVGRENSLIFKALGMGSILKDAAAPVL